MTDSTSTSTSTSTSSQTSNPLARQTGHQQRQRRMTARLAAFHAADVRTAARDDDAMPYNDDVMADAWRRAFATLDDIG